MGKHHGFHGLTTGTALGLLGLLIAFAGCSGSVTNADGCDYNGKRYAVGDTFPATDGCNHCTCGEQGDAQCTLLGCGPGVPEPVHPDPDPEPEPVDPGPQPNPGPSCDSLQKELKSTLSDVQRCTSAADCGQPIPGSSCGCTRDLVARKDANLSSYLAQRAKVSELGCATDGGSTCDCPSAEGFTCTNNVCGWNYVRVEPEPEPACQPYQAARLCVRGTPTADGGELLREGDALQVTVGSAGCLSSSCSQVVEAFCAIDSNATFDVKASFCVKDLSHSGIPCTADCGRAQAKCSFGQPLKAGEHQVTLGSIAVGFQVPSVLPIGGLCAGTAF